MCHEQVSASVFFGRGVWAGLTTLRECVNQAVRAVCRAR